MANWISSKLKVAETFFEQIDQQAAESLKKGENPRLDLPDLGAPKSGGSVPLKDQLKKKKKTPEKNGGFGKLRNDPYPVGASSNLGGVRDVSSTYKLSLKPSSSLKDSDWTELLSTPNQPSSPVVSGGNKVSAIRGLRKDSKKQGKNLGSSLNFPVSEVKRNQKGTGSNSSNAVLSPGTGKFGVATQLLSDGKQNDCLESQSRSSASVGKASNMELQNEGKYLDGGDGGRQDIVENLVVEVTDETSKENGEHFGSKNVASEDFSRTPCKNCLLDVEPVSVGNDVLHSEVRNTVRGKRETNAASLRSGNTKRGSSSSTDGGSDSDDSALSSDSESEGEREERKRRREKILVEKAAAKAAEAIKERENKVARLEGEKQSLEKILEERDKQQAQEASDLQSAMMQMMEAVDLEKQKHNNTRMEAFARLAKLETTNAVLARSLATAQWNLEVEVNRITDLKQHTEMKEVAHEELRSRISNSRQSKLSQNQLAAPKGIELEREILESEYSLITDKVKRMQDKAKELETNIEMARKEVEDPTEVEVELKRRLDQLTDHLIQKQSQVEALSSEKASLSFRIEAVSRMLEENKDITDPSLRDVESGTWVISRSKWQPLFQEKLHSGRKHLGSLLVQLDAIFSAGAAFLRRNSTAKVWALIYLVCLHFWVIYILKSYSQPSTEARYGAVISLENINNTGRV